MNIFIANCHTANRGDEAAVHALIDELLLLYPKANIVLGMRGETRYPNLPDSVTSISQVIIDNNLRYKYKYYIVKATRGRITLGRKYTEFFRAIKKADMVLHAPGGPSIGDTYYEAEVSYLYIYELLQTMNKPYMFYAPSMGPFNRTERNKWRKKVISGAEAVVLRDPISAEHVRKLLPGKRIYQTLDSAFQHDIDLEYNKKKLDGYSELRLFLGNHNKCVGITITDLLWHPVHSKNESMIRNIRESFSAVLKELADQGYGIVFIPQLYGSGNDYNLMKSYAANDTDFFVIPDNDTRYDTYFQQYVIGQLYAVIGMRYHSNIFSAKMGTPFISVSYEQKMQGFMEKMNLSQYCIRLDDLSADILKEKFELVVVNYNKYATYLTEKHEEMKADAYRTTQIVKEILENNQRK